MRKTEDQRFWDKVNVLGPDECWEWRGAPDKDGYGRLQIMCPSKTVKAHRWSYAYSIGVGIRDLDVPVVRHTCDNPPCVNPAHLLPGTVKDNARDAAERGLLADVKGEKHGRAKLTDEKVRYARSIVVDGRGYKIAPGITQAELCYLWDVSRPSMCFALGGKTWSHV